MPERGGDVAQLAIEEHATRDLAARVGIAADARRVHGHRRPIPRLLRLRPRAVRACAQERAHAGADTLLERLGVQTDERLLNGLASVAVALFRSRLQLVVYRREAPGDGRMQLDQTRLTARTAAAPAVLARLARAAATHLHVFAQSAFLDRDGECHQRQIHCGPQRSILVVDRVGVRHAVLDFGAVELRAKQLLRRRAEGLGDRRVAMLGVLRRLLHDPGIVEVGPSGGFGLRCRLDRELRFAGRYLLEHEREKQRFEVHG